MRLERSIEQYRNGKPEVIVKGSEAQVLFALQDSRKDVLALAAEVDRLTEERDRIERNRDMWRGQTERQASSLDSMRGEFLKSVEECKRLTEAMQECEDYFDNRADAEYFPDSAAPVPNEEMKLLTLVRDALGKAAA